MKTSHPGINIQFPISQLILDGRKTIETRRYPLPAKYIGKELFIIETPGKDGKFSARIVGTIRFSNCFLYNNKKQFYKDWAQHFVDKTSPYAWTTKKKWGWEIEKVTVFKQPIQAPRKKGICF